MKQAKAVTKFVRINPRKARLVAGIVRGKDVVEALSQLRFNNTKAGRHLHKTLHSAIANAETNNELRRENLIVKEVRVDEGARYKRSKPKNKGGRHPILKRTSHLTVVVGEK